MNIEKRKQVTEQIKDQLQPIEWRDENEFGFIKANTLLISYSIRANTESKVLPYLIYYDGRQPKEFESIKAAKKWAQDVHLPSKLAQWVKPVDPFAKLNFYKLENQETWIAHGRVNSYRIHKLTPTSTKFWVHVLKNATQTYSSTKHINDAFNDLEQAQAWCQQDYDIYYKGLSDD